MCMPLADSLWEHPQLSAGAHKIAGKTPLAESASLRIRRRILGQGQLGMSPTLKSSHRIQI